MKRKRFCQFKVDKCLDDYFFNEVDATDDAIVDNIVCTMPEKKPSDILRSVGTSDLIQSYKKTQFSCSSAKITSNSTYISYKKNCIIVGIQSIEEINYKHILYLSILNDYPMKKFDYDKITGEIVKIHFKPFIEKNYSKKIKVHNIVSGTIFESKYIYLPQIHIDNPKSTYTPTTFPALSLSNIKYTIQIFRDKIRIVGADDLEVIKPAIRQAKTLIMKSYYKYEALKSMKFNINLHKTLLRIKNDNDNDNDSMNDSMNINENENGNRNGNGNKNKYEFNINLNTSDLF
jgi:TATA-box binding protein (TBP) (component of TFIID and TFIIIB)